MGPLSIVVDCLIGLGFVSVVIAIGGYLSKQDAMFQQRNEENK